MITDEKEKEKMKDQLIISINVSKEKDMSRIVVGRKKGRGIQIINQLFDEEAEKIYYKLINTQGQSKRDKDKRLYENIITVDPEEHHRNKNKLYIAEYMQNPFEILTEKNLKKLEEHCKKAIHYERGTIKEEHEVTLNLLYRYQEQQEQIEKQSKIIDSMAEVICRLDIMNNYNSWNNDIQEVKKYFGEMIING